LYWRVEIELAALIGEPNRKHSVSAIRQQIKVTFQQTFESALGLNRHNFAVSEGCSNRIRARTLIGTNIPEDIIALCTELKQDLRYLGIEVSQHQHVPADEIRGINAKTLAAIINNHQIAPGIGLHPSQSIKQAMRAVFERQTPENKGNQCLKPRGSPRLLVHIHQISFRLD
jgi:hypothetical protein